MYIKISRAVGVAGPPGRAALYAHESGVRVTAARCAESEAAWWPVYSFDHTTTNKLQYTKPATSLGREKEPPGHSQLRQDPAAHICAHAHARRA